MHSANRRLQHSIDSKDSTQCVTIILLSTAMIRNCHISHDGILELIVRGFISVLHIFEEDANKEEEIAFLTPQLNGITRKGEKLIPFSKRLLGARLLDSPVIAILHISIGSPVVSGSLCCSKSTLMIATAVAHNELVLLML